MLGRKAMLLIAVIGLTLYAGACSRGVTDSTDKQKVGKPDAGAPNAGLIEVIKNGKLVNYQSTTIGNAFESYRYLTKKEWKAEPLKGGQFVVDYMGWLEPGTLNDNDRKAGVTGRGLDIKFVIEANGAYYVFMALKMETRSDGKIYTSQVNDIPGILASIYANRKISL